MTTVPPPFFDVFQSYFQSTTKPSLADFVESHEQTIIAYHQKGEDLALIWSTRYGKAQSFYYRNILKRKPPKVNANTVDFGKVALKILSSEVPVVKQEDSTTLASKSGDSTTSNSTGSNRSAVHVSSVFLDRFRRTYENMINEKKWILTTGKVVENEIFEHALQSQFENLSHSFIIDPSDPLWKNRFTSDEIDEIRRHKPHTLPPCPDQLLDYLNCFSDIKTLDALSSQTRTISEQSQKARVGELGCAEVGKKDDGDYGTKELHEMGLKCPKMMKDQLCHLIKATPHHQYDLAIAGFVIMGLKLRVMVMDRPSMYVCRIQKTPALFFPSNVETIGARLGALLALVMQVKQLVCQTLSLVNEPVLVVSQGFDDPNHNEDLPSCPSTP